MTQPFNRKRRGFSLIEMVIVMGIVGAMIAGIWVYSKSAQQTVKVEQAVEAVSTIADTTRAAYGGQASISGGVWVVMPILVQTGAMPPNLMRPAASTCSGVSTNYADTPWAGVYNSCGTLLVCAWSYGASTACGNFVGSQYFAIEFDELDYPSCVSLVQSVVPSRPPGLQDVYINGGAGAHSVVNNGTAVVAGGNSLPVSPSVATSWCTPNVTTNIVDFVYKLRTTVY